MNRRQIQAAGGLLAVLLAGTASAAHPLLSPVQVTDLAKAAAEASAIDMTSFSPLAPLFDPVTRLWVVDFLEALPKAEPTPAELRAADRSCAAAPIGGYCASPQRKLAVFVYDTSSRTEVGCIGLYPRYPMATGKLPAEVQPFVPKNEWATELECADLNGDGRPDYVLITQQPIGTLPGGALVAGYRVLQILLRQPSGLLVSAVRNEHAVGASSGDYEIIARRGRFEIVNEFPRCCVETAYFAYSNEAHTWVLTRADTRVAGRVYGGRDRYRMPTLKHFAKVTISAFSVGAGL